jgi:peptide/nickel transport system ATP-binding protein
MTAPVLEAPILDAHSLTKHFPIRGGVVHAVDDVSLVIPAGSITAIVGESGSGKSTLARMLARLIKPTSGALLLDGQFASAPAQARREYAKAVQLVLQDPFSSLNPIHDVRYHLARPLKVHKLAGKSASLDEAIGRLLARVSLSPPALFAGKLPHELSGGQRQRVAIARALAVEPRLLLADEPVSMLDVSIRLGVLNLLADLRESNGLAIVYVTHDIASARYLADVVAVMYAGKIVESGPAGVITGQPAHPYTELLLSAAPNPQRRAATATIVRASGTTAPIVRGKGASPNLVSPPPGCRFHPRCPHAMRICASKVPAMTHISPGHVSACWLHASGLDQQQRAPLAGRPGKQ